MITTFDNKQWTKEELLSRMYDDTFYYGYLGQNALSSSSCKKILKSPKEYLKKDSGSSAALVAGRIFHTILLEPEKVKDLTIVDVTTRNTKAFKEALTKHDEATVYTKREFNTADYLVNQIRQADEVNDILNGCLFEQPEAMMFEGLPFRGKADVLGFNSVIDVKTTSSPIADFKWSADKYGYDLQAYLYLQMFGKDEFKFIVIDKSNADVGIFECSDKFLERGKQKLYKAIENYNKFFVDKSEDVSQYVFKGVL